MPGNECVLVRRRAHTAPVITRSAPRARPPPRRHAAPAHTDAYAYTRARAPVAAVASEGALAPLLTMAKFAPDMLKLSALSALDVLAVNNEGVKRELKQVGGCCGWKFGPNEPLMRPR